MWKKKEEMDIMSGAPRFEKILGHKFFIPFSPVDKVLHSALMRSMWMGQWMREQ